MAAGGSSAYLDLESDHVESHGRANCASRAPGGDRERTISTGLADPLLLKRRRLGGEKAEKS